MEPVFVDCSDGHFEVKQEVLDEVDPLAVTEEDNKQEIIEVVEEFQVERDEDPSDFKELCLLDQFRTSFSSPLCSEEHEKLCQEIQQTKAEDQFVKYRLDLQTLNTEEVDRKEFFNKPHCKKTDELCKISSNLGSENKNQVSVQKPFKCEMCYKSFAVSQGLLRHKRSHKGEKPYKCDVCNKSFTQSSDLGRHKFIHTGVKLHKCEVCNKSFTQSSTLRNHQRIHTGEQPYKCEVCNKSFTQSSHLRIHQRKHTGERPYKCEVCNKLFTRPCHLTRHKRIHWGTTLQV